MWRHIEYICMWSDCFVTLRLVVYEGNTNVEFD